MTEERYFSIDYNGEYYIFDSNTVTLEELGEKALYSYNEFTDSLTSKEIIDLLNESGRLEHDYGQLQYEMSQIIQKYNELEKENERLKKEIKQLKHWNK